MNNDHKPRDIADVLGDVLLEEIRGAPDPAVIALLRGQGLSDAQIRTFLGLAVDYPL